MTQIENPQVLALFISPTKGVPMEERECVEAIAGKGLDGDRYAKGEGAWSAVRKGTIRHVSLISQEDIDAANKEHDTDFTPPNTRRNILVTGVDLNSLVGKEFEIGGVRMRGAEPCDPCQRPSALSKKPGFEAAFQGRGGLRAEVLSSGTIRRGDAITIVSYQ